MAKPLRSSVPEEFVFLLDWPKVPEEFRPKVLFVDSDPGRYVRDILSGRGWRLVDVRELPNATDADRSEGVKAYLEGVRSGTMRPNKEVLSHVELEAKIFGLVGTKDPSMGQNQARLDTQDIDTILNFGGKAKQKVLDPNAPVQTEDN